MSRYTWQTAPSKVIFISDQGGPFVAPCLGSKMADLMDSVMSQWGELARRNEERCGVPREWTLAMIFRESGGNPRAQNTEDPPGLGLMQITSKTLKHGLTNAEVLDPELNVAIGTNFIKSIMDRQPDRDLPSIASVYNAGGWGAMWLPHPDPHSPWGIRETRGHILAEVAASNYALGKRLGAGVLIPAAQLSDQDAIVAMSVVDVTLWNLAGEAMAEADAAAQSDRLASWPNEVTRPGIKKEGA